eukprot:4262478-Pleurochrysis_carterae.AAC.6
MSSSVAMLLARRVRAEKGAEKKMLWQSPQGLGPAGELSPHSLRQTVWAQNAAAARGGGASRDVAIARSGVQLLWDNVSAIAQVADT